MACCASTTGYSLHSVTASFGRIPAVHIVPAGLLLYNGVRQKLIVARDFRMSIC